MRCLPWFPLTSSSSRHRVGRCACTQLSGPLMPTQWTSPASRQPAICPLTPFNCTVISLGNRCMLSVVLVSVNVEMTAAGECQITQCVGFEFGLEIAFSHSIFRFFGIRCLENGVKTTIFQHHKYVSWKFKLKLMFLWQFWSYSASFQSWKNFL